MGIDSFVRRVRWYRNKHGWVKLIELAAMSIWRHINKQEYMYFLDLNTLERDHTLNTDNITVACYKKESDIPITDMEQLIGLKSNEILLSFLHRYFSRGATLWLAKKSGEIVSLIWSLNGGFNGFYTGLPMGPNDSTIIAGETFPEFRGRNYFAVMIMLICENLKAAGMSRAYVVAHISNKASQRALSKILKRIGAARHFHINHWHIVIWDEKSFMTHIK